MTTSYFLTSSYWRSFVCAVSGCAVFHMLESHGWGLEASQLEMDVIVAPHLRTQYYWVLPTHVLLGIMCGALAALFVRIAALLFTMTRPWTKVEEELSPAARLQTMRWRKCDRIVQLDGNRCHALPQ